MTDPEPPASRRALRTAGVGVPSTRRGARRAARRRRALVLGGAGALVLWGGIALTSALTGAAGEAGGAADGPPVRSAAPAPWATALPVPTMLGAETATPSADPQPQPAPADGICADAAVTGALASGDDVAVIAAAGGAVAFREAVARGAAPCIDLADPARIWVLVNKLRPYAVLDYAPSSLVAAGSVPGGNQAILRADAAAALQSMAEAARAAGAEFGVQSGYRSFGMQQSIYDAHVDQRGVAATELVSARPGHSEHQSGLAADVVSCADGCGDLDDLAGTAADQWIRAHAWEHGWIIRYEEGYTHITGYAYEPWHLRYVGVDLARAYHDGGFHSLEEFFELGPAPDYAD
ncbi:M15 family metallopeptidase [Microbacterium sp. zg.Y625]|uniref:M15 family metallopeptidase n=1 Tax=Microbacterium jiangjiandongii TaxID=3049071 RepID=UPI00214C0C3B|nr:MULTISPECIES: M15 family metallopeptidase [unclassified Microbacterium]MCR2794122.1 M15 family metallopeptidase [Microbacterium sp. zg.Y625]WIM25583.1 M15 family metallopeptidase [Microbacterium sp. zg-Y625]